MSDVKRYTLSNINEIELESKDELIVKDSVDGHEKKVKTVNRAEIATIFAYLLGVSDSHLDEYFSHYYQHVLDKLRKSRPATIVRLLSRIRTTLFKNFVQTDNEIRYNLKNLDSIECFDAQEINRLAVWGIHVQQPNARAGEYIQIISKLIEENIDKCKELFPETVKFQYIKSVFVIPKCEKKEVAIAEYNKYKGNRKSYPFQMYMYWKPDSYGNILSSDEKLLTIIYKQNGEEFVEGYKYKDVSESTKGNIYDFIKKAKQVVMAVDCENSDPYKLLGVLKNLNSESVERISKILLYDDYHTTFAWDYIEKFISVPVEHVEVDRINDLKSLVDIKMAVGISAEYYCNDVDSFILCSSDSDFWGLISSLPAANFLVLYEHEKCGEAIKRALDEREIFYCALDDFYLENASELQKVVLKKVLEGYLPNIIGENAWELTKKIYSESYIQATDIEMKRFYEKYMKNLKLKIGPEGNYYVEIE